MSRGIAMPLKVSKKHHCRSVMTALLSQHRYSIKSGQMKKRHLAHRGRAKSNHSLLLSPSERGKKK